MHDVLVECGNEVVLVDTTRNRQLGIGQHGRKINRIDGEPWHVHLKSAELQPPICCRRNDVSCDAFWEHDVPWSKRERKWVTTVRGLVREQGGTIPSCDTEHFISKVRAQKLTSDITRVIDALLATVQVTDTQLAIVEQQLAGLCA